MAYIMIPNAKLLLKDEIVVGNKEPMRRVIVSENGINSEPDIYDFVVDNLNGLLLNNIQLNTELDIVLGELQYNEIGDTILNVLYFRLRQEKCMDKDFLRIPDFEDDGLEA